MEKDGAVTFSKDAWISEEHEKWLPDTYFPLVGQMKRNPRYTNRRCMDPHLKCYIDEADVDLKRDWGLPTPNQEAAYKSLAKYAKDIPALEPDEVEDLNRAWEYTRSQFGPYMLNSRILDLEEALAKVDMSTSSGAPFNVRFSKKKELFEKDPDIVEWLRKDWDIMADENLLWTCLFTNSLKEEVRPAEKMLENSQRTFLAGGVDAVVHGTRLFVDMNEKFYASHIRSSSAVGLSPYKGNWNLLYQKLNVFDKGFALDESQYDSSLRAHLMWGCARFRYNMLAEQYRTPENLRRLLVYYRNLVNTLVITPDGVLVLKQGGNPSGSVNTISDNTLILYTLLAYAWIRTAPAEYKTYLDFEKHTAKALVGDDNTWTVSDIAFEWFNARSVIATWKRLGITTTTDSLDPRKPKELDFLSAHTIFMDGMAVPLYDRTKLMTSLLYAPREHHTPATTLERTAAMLSVGWTDLPFRRFCRDVIDWLMAEYDKVLFDEPRWMAAKCQIQDDERYRKLFLGSTLLRPQGYDPGARVKLIQPGKTKMNAVKPQSKGANPSKKQQKARARNGKAKVRSQAKGRRPRRGPRNNRSRKGGGGPSGVGSTKTFQRAKRTCTIVEDEYVAEINGSTAFDNTRYAINPGNSALFPWLSKQAAQWEKYHFNTLEFYYKREVSEFATQGQSGKIMLSVDFDATDPPPTDKRMIEDTDPHVDGMPCENIRLALRQQDMHGLLKTLFVRNAGPNSLALGDLKTYDVGNLNVATQGEPNSDVIGELRVKYSVTFSVPVLEALQTIDNRVAAMWIRELNQVLANGVAEDMNPETGVYNGINVTESGGEFILPFGLYQISTSVTMSTDATAGALFEIWQIMAGSTKNYARQENLGGVGSGQQATLSLTSIIRSDGVQPYSTQVKLTAGGGTTYFIEYGSVSILAIAS